jgi:ribosomal protein S6--L-glutamate ligase
MMQELAGPGVPMPTSFMPSRGSKASEALDRLGGAPVVVKLTRGSKSAGAMLCESQAALQSVVDLLWSESATARYTERAR